MHALPSSAEYLPQLLKNHKSEFLELIREHSRPLLPLSSGYAPKDAVREEIRAVVFDIYGTLLISSRGEVGSDTAAGKPRPVSPGTPSLTEGPFTAALRRAGYTPLRKVEERAAVLYETLIRESHAADRARGITHPEVDILSIWERLLQTLAKEQRIDRKPYPYGVVTAALGYELRSNRVWPMPGMREMLQDLASRGALLGIVSNAQFYTPLMLEALLGVSLEELGITYQVWSYREREGKPSFHLFQLLLERISREGRTLRPEECVYVGNDMLNDMYPASITGFHPVLFAGDARSLRLREKDPAVRSIEPEAVCTDLHQLSNIVTIKSM